MGISAARARNSRTSLRATLATLSLFVPSFTTSRSTAVALRVMNRAVGAQLAGTDPGERQPQDEILDILDDVLALDVTNTPILAIVTAPRSS